MGEEQIQQLIYRQDRAEGFDVQLAAGVNLVSCRMSADLVGRAVVFLRHLGVVGFLKDVLKLATSMQKLLGDVHDADVCRERIETYVRRRGRALDASAIAGADALLNHLAARRTARMKAASRVWHKAQAKKELAALKKSMKRPATS